MQNETFGIHLYLDTFEKPPTDSVFKPFLIVFFKVKLSITRFLGLFCNFRGDGTAAVEAVGRPKVGNLDEDMTLISS